MRRERSCLRSTISLHFNQNCDSIEVIEEQRSMSLVREPQAASTSSRSQGEGRQPCRSSGSPTVGRAMGRHSSHQRSCLTGTQLSRVETEPRIWGAGQNTRVGRAAEDSPPGFSWVRISRGMRKTTWGQRTNWKDKKRPSTYVRHCHELKSHERESHALDFLPSSLPMMLYMCPSLNSWVVINPGCTLASTGSFKKYKWE